MFARKPGKGITLEMYIRNTQVKKIINHIDGTAELIFSFVVCMRLHPG